MPWLDQSVCSTMGRSGLKRLSAAPGVHNLRLSKSKHCCASSSHTNLALSSFFNRSFNGAASAE